MADSKPSCATLLDVEGQATLAPHALIQFIERDFEVEAKAAYAEFSHPNVRRAAKTTMGPANSW